MSSFQHVLFIYSLEHGQIPNKEFIPKRGWIFFCLYPCQKSSLEESGAVVTPPPILQYGVPEMCGTSSPARGKTSSPCPGHCWWLMRWWARDRASSPKLGGFISPLRDGAGSLKYFGKWGISSPGHSSVNMASGFRRQPRPQATAWGLVVIQEGHRY